MKSIFMSLRIFTLIIIINLFFSGNMIALAESSTEKEDVNIHWAFGALTGAENNRRLISINKDTTLKTGDQFKMMVEFKSKCFVYLIYHGSNDEIQILFPYDWNQLNKGFNAYERYYIPQGDLWFALDKQTGIETFYLLASKSRLVNLESLLKKYESSNLTAKQDIAIRIIAEIKKTRAQHKKLAAKAERPVQIGGNVRGTKEQRLSIHDISTLAVEISAPNFYGKTFTIEHQ